MQMREYREYKEKYGPMSPHHAQQSKRRRKVLRRLKEHVGEASVSSARRQHPLQQPVSHPDDEDFDSVKKARLHKRDWNPTLNSDHFDPEHNHDDVKRNWTEKHYQPNTNDHWELRHDDNIIRFISHTTDSIHERMAELANSTVEESKEQHRLFKRGLLDSFRSGKERFKDILDSDPKSIIVSSEDDNMIVKVFTVAGKIIRVRFLFNFNDFSWAFQLDTSYTYFSHSLGGYCECFSSF